MKTNSEEELYDGQVRFLYHDGQHKYSVSKQVGTVWGPPTPVTGITTITGIINKDALVFWAAKTAAYYMRDILVKHPQSNVPLLAEEAKIAHKEESRKAAGTGKIGHKLIEALLLGQAVKMPERADIKEAIQNIRDQHEQFEKDFQPKNIHVEKPMYSLKWNFAGTDDRFCIIDGKKILIDYKTSNRGYYSPDGIYASNFAQLGGQSILIEEQLGETVDDMWITNFAKDSKEYKFKRLSDLGLTKTDAQLYFIHCLSLYNSNATFEWKVKS